MKSIPCCIAPRLGSVGHGGEVTAARGARQIRPLAAALSSSSMCLLALCAQVRKRETRARPQPSEEDKGSNNILSHNNN